MEGIDYEVMILFGGILARTDFRFKTSMGAENSLRFMAL